MTEKTIILTSVSHNRSMEVEHNIVEIKTLLSNKDEFIELKRIQGKFTYNVLLRKTQIKMVREKL